MRNLLERTLHSYAPFILGLLLFLTLWGLRLAGILGEPLPDTSLSVFGITLPVGMLAQSIISPILYLLSCYLLFRTIGEYQLYNARTHFPTGLFFAFVAGAPFLMPLQAGSISLVIILIALYVLMSTYQRHDAISEYLIGFSFLSLASILFPKWFFLVPFLLIGGSMMQSLTPRTFMATIIGLIIPYWISAGILFLFDKLDLFIVPFQQLIQFDAISYTNMTLNEITAAGMLIFLAIPSFVMFPSTLFTIKEKARVSYQYLLLVFITTFILALLQPNLFVDLLPLLISIACLFVTQMLISSKSRMGGIYILLLLIFYLIYISQPLWEPLVPF